MTENVIHWCTKSAGHWDDEGVCSSHWHPWITMPEELFFWLEANKPEALSWIENCLSEY
jgi:hypothetical protein